MRKGFATIATFCAALSTLTPSMVQGQSSPSEGPQQMAAQTAAEKPVLFKVPGRKQNVVFTLAYGNDSRTNAQIAVEMARLLQNPATFYPPFFKPKEGSDKNNSWSPTTSIVVPEGSWTLRTFVDQCKADDKVKGAFIALPAAIESESISRFLSARTVKRLSFDVVVADCKHGQMPEASIIAELGVKTGIGESTVYSLVPFALGVALYTLLAPSRTTQVTRTQVFPTTPLPVNGTVSQIQTSTSVANGQASGNLSGAFLTLFSSQYSNAVNLSTGATSADALTGDAIRDALVDVEVALRDACLKPPSDPGEKRAQFCEW